MAKWPWIERTFNFEFPPTKFPDVLERVRGTPARIEDQVSGLSAGVLVRSDGRGWSIQENIGHLADLEELHSRRIGEILDGSEVLTAADMSNRTTHEANHNARTIEELLTEFRVERAQFVARLEALPEADWRKASVHPRIKQTMRMVDLVFFASEHDDYHLARINELIRTFS